MLTYPWILLGSHWRSFPCHSWWCWVSLQSHCVLQSPWHEAVQDKSHETAAICPVGTGPPAEGVSVGPSPAGWNWLLPSPVRVETDPQQLWAGAHTVAVQMVKWECFSHFSRSFEEFVIYFLACCFGTEVKISDGSWQICTRNKTSEQL